MSVMPWGTMNDWQRLDVDERATKAERRLTARATRAARRGQAAPVVRSRQPATAALSKADCTEAA